MGDTWISDIGHFLDEDGMIPFDLPGPASRLAHYFGSIVESVSSRQDHNEFHTGIKCRRRPGHKPCTGKIVAVIDDKNEFAIIWQCPICDDKGIISGWQGTIFDKSSGT